MASFQVQYIIDEVGYAETVTAASAEDAKADCEGRIKTAHPASTCEVIKIEKVEKAKKAKDKDGKDEKEEE